MPPLLVLTIGQAPRHDIAAELATVLGDTPLEVRGALDGLGDPEIDALAPVSDADALHTRLPGGRDVVVSKAAVTARMADLVSRAGSRPTLVACTGRFAGLPERPNVLYPSIVLEHLVDAVLPGEGRLGVMVPLPEQVVGFEQQWSRPGRPATAVAVTPGADPDDAAAALDAAGVDLILLDCFGYHRDTLERMRRLTGRPVLSAVRCTAQLAGELLA